jgi:hypothetical protein
LPQLEPLNLRITGNANGLSAELGRAKRDVDGFNSDITGKAGGISSLFSGLAGPIAAGVTAGFAALAAGAIASAAAIRTVVAELDKIADKQDVANKLAIRFTELRGLEFALGELSGLDSDTIDNALQKLLVGLDEARTKASGPVKDALDRLGLDAGELLLAGPVEALKQIAEQTQAIADPTLQLGIAYDLFGKNAAGLVNALRAGASAIEESYNFAAEWLGLTEAQVEAAASTSDAWARIGVIFEGFAQSASAELAPLFAVLVQDFLTIVEETKIWVDELGGSEVVMRRFADTFAYVVGLAQDLFEYLNMSQVALKALASGDFRGASDAINNGLAFDTGQSLMDRLQSERNALEFATLPEPEKKLSSVNANTRFNEQLTDEQAALREQQRVEAEREERRHQERIGKFKDAERELQRLREAVKAQDTPTPVDL